MPATDDKKFFQQIFKLRLTILLIIIFWNTISLVSVNALGILSDEELVERLVIDMSHTKKTWITKLMERVKGRSICYMAPKMKLYLCQLYLKEEWNDFDFTWPLSSTKSIDCTDQRYSLLMLDEKLLKSTSVFLYQCPSTNEGEYLGQMPLVYISGSHFKNSAFVFVRKNQSSPLYPHRLIDGFSFEQLAEESGHFLKFVNRKSLLRRKSSLNKLDDDWFIVEAKNALNVAKWRQLNTPYEKFIQFYPLLSICSLSNLQKLNICKLIKSKQYVENTHLEFDENQDLRCKKQMISYSYTTLLSNSVLKKAVPLVKCPALAILEEDKDYKRIRKIYSSFHFFISACDESDCLIVYEIMTHLGETRHKIESVYFNVDIEILSQTKSIVERLPYRNMERNQNTLSTPLSFQFLNYAKAYQLDSNLTNTEEEVLKLFEAINVTLPYKKFEKTFNKLNICGRDRKKKMELCTTTFGNQLFGYEIDGTIDEQSILCHRFEVILNQFEGKQNVAMIRCPILKHQHFLGHFLSGGITKKMVVMYSQSEMYRKIYPTSLAPKVPEQNLDDYVQSTRSQ